MAALIRCLELRLITGSTYKEDLLSISRDQIKHRLADMWLDECIMEPVGRDDYSHIEALVERFGREYIKDEYINKRTLRKALENMRELYARIKGE